MKHERDLTTLIIFDNKDVINILALCKRKTKTFPSTMTFNGGSPEDTTLVKEVFKDFFQGAYKKT